MILKTNKKQKEYFNFLENEKVKVLYMESFIRNLQKSVFAISKLFKEYNINFSIIGGVARNQYGINKQTEDIDILVSNQDKDKIKSLPIGYIKDISNGRGKVFKLHEPESKIEIIYSGEISGDGIKGLEYLEPDKISNIIENIPYMTLKELIRYKLSSGIYGKRLKDFADIQELIIKNNLTKDYAKKFRKDLRKKYIEIWKKT